MAQGGRSKNHTKQGEEEASDESAYKVGEMPLRERSEQNRCNTEESDTPTQQRG